MNDCRPQPGGGHSTAQLHQATGVSSRDVVGINGAERAHLSVENRA
jgi:hypothetical protein